MTDSGSQRKGPSPAEALRTALEQKGWTQEELAEITGKSLRQIKYIIAGQSGITPDTATVLAAAFGSDPEYWMRLETDQQLSLIDSDPSDVRERAALYEIAPVKDMQKRGWIRPVSGPSQIRTELCRFFEVESLDTPPEISVATRRPGSGTDELNGAQRAWCFRAKQLARLIKAPRYTKAKGQAAAGELRSLASQAESTREIGRVLGEHGIRFVVVEPIAGAKIDGATLWLSESEPVIAVSLRTDRIDGVWFTVMHELAHVLNGDASVDDRLVGEDHIPSLAKDEAERLADEWAANSLIPAKQIESFILRVGPLYTKARINQFARRNSIHPGIVVGQLQHRGEVKYSSFRDSLSKVRSRLVSSSMSDGWGAEPLNLGIKEEP